MNNYCDWDYAKNVLDEDALKGRTEGQNPCYILYCYPALHECMFRDKQHSGVSHNSHKLLLDRNTYFWCKLLWSVILMHGITGEEIS